jgi:hypothetical protein
MASSTKKCVSSEFIELYESGNISSDTSSIKKCDFTESESESCFWTSSNVFSLKKIFSEAGSASLFR